MSVEKTEKNLISLINELVKQPTETEWLEFKHNRASGQEIGEYISALSNSAALYEKQFAYIIWGVEDKTHEIIGTTFKPNKKKVGSEELENWLLRLLTPKINFRFYESCIDGNNIVLLEIASAFRHPVRFENIEYIRIGSYKKKLKDFPERERELWRVFDKIPFEKQIALDDIDDDNVIKLLDYPAYFDLLDLPLPDNKEGILKAFEAEEMLIKTDSNKWNITNLAAILFAKNLSAFSSLARKAIRVISYEGNTRMITKKEQDGIKGYAVSFKRLIDYINSLLPSNEIIKKAIRKSTLMYPEIAIRELVANAIIHQDFFLTGQSVMIEIFSNRIEIRNPGKPLINIERFIDNPPRSRNERLASFMRRIGVCEERGSGIDKVVLLTEVYQLPAPLFETSGDNTTAVLFAHKSLDKMDKSDRIRACYMHACLKYVNREYMTNSTLRERLGIETKNSAKASRYIKEALESGLIVLQDEKAAPKMRKYVPFWAPR